MGTMVTFHIADGESPCGIFVGAVLYDETQRSRAWMVVPLSIVQAKTARAFKVAVNELLLGKRRDILTTLDRAITGPMSECKVCSLKADYAYTFINGRVLVAGESRSAFDPLKCKFQRE